MKRFISLLMCALAFLPVKASATVVSDNFATLYEEPWNKYHNLTKSSGGIDTDYGWEKPPDNTTLLMSSPQVVSAAIYAVTNAQTAQFFIYSGYSTVAATLDGEYYLGVVARSDKNTLTRTRISSLKGGVYLQVNQSWQKAFMLNNNKVKFVPTFPPLPFLDKGENYGLTVLASEDNENFVELPLTIGDVRNSKYEGADFLCYYENYSCSIPKNTKFIKLELRETRGFDKLSGGFLENTQTGSLRFAEVNFLGTGVEWGSFPQPEPPKPPTPSSEPPPISSETTSSVPTSSVPDETSSGDTNTSTGETSSHDDTSSDDTSSQETTSDDTSSDDTSSDETSSEDDTSESDFESDWTTDPSGDDPDLQKPVVRPAKPQKAPKIDDDEEKPPSISKKVSIKAASKVSNKPPVRASSKAPSKVPSKSIQASVLPPALPSLEAKSESKAKPVQGSEPKRDLVEEKRMAVAGTYIAGAAFALAGLIRKP